MKNPRNSITLWIFALVICVFFTQTTAAQLIVYVDANADPNGASDGSSWANAYNYLQDALDVAQAGDTILVAQGAYKPSWPTDPNDPRSATFQLIDGVTIEGGYAGFGEPDPNERNITLYETILSGDIGTVDVNSDNSYHVVTGSGTDANAILDGFTITAGYADGTDLNNKGAGMYNENGSPTVTDCNFSDNEAAADGAGMYNIYGSSPTLTNCILSDNSAGYDGGGMHNHMSNPTLTSCTLNDNSASVSGGGMWSGSSSPTLINCTFSGNSANANGGGMRNVSGNPTLSNCRLSGNTAAAGGGMCNTDSDPNLTNCTFSGNSADDEGGGMYNYDHSSPTMTNCTFTGNSAIWGGGMYNNDNSSPMVTNCTFSGNSIENVGGGMYNRTNSSPILTNCTFSGNAADSGSGMYNYIDSNPTLINCTFTANSANINGSGMYNTDSSPTLTNCTFSDNLADLFGGGIYNSGTSNPTLTNCILWGNSASGTDEYAQICNQYGGGAVVNYCCVQGWTGGLGGTGNIGDDPLLRDAKGHIWSSSPCRNAGDPNFITDPNAPYDIDGQDRVLEGRVEIGADELPPLIQNINTGATYNTIQEAINDANNGDTIVVQDGTYYTPSSDGIDFLGKAITVRSSDPNDPNVVAATIIDGQDAGRCLYFNNGEGPNSVLNGFTIMNGYADPGGGIYCENSSPTISHCIIRDNDASFQNGDGIACANSVPVISDSTIRDNSPDGVSIDASSIVIILGTVHIISNNIVGEGSLEIDPNASLNLDDAEVFSGMSGAGTMEIEVGAEATIDGNSIIDLGDPYDPNVRGTIDCEGLLQVKDNAQIINANINITRATFEDDANVTNCEIHVDSSAPYGQFFIDANASFTYNDIHADGDRYMDLDPNIFSGLFVHNRIFVTITEGVGQASGGLFELRGDPKFADPNCDPNEFMCQMDPCTIPDCNLTTWTIERLELIEGAKLNLTNRFPFQPPYEPGSDDDVLYVKELILRANSVFNTAFNWVYYETLTIEPNAVIKDEPFLGFSLTNIALDDETEFIIRVVHNNFIDLEPDPCDYTRIHVERVEGNEPDPNGMMRMCNLLDIDPNSPHYQEVINARAKGLFAKASEDKILILFEYLFETSDPNVELVVYLSDVPELLDHNDPNRADHYLKVARLGPPPAGRYGSADSNHFGVFEKTVPAGDLYFIRGVRMELELVGPEGSCILINNWDPLVSCIFYCGDVTGDDGVTVRDFLTALGEYGGLSGSKNCLNGIFSDDGYVSMTDLMGADWLHWLGSEGLLSFCFDCLDEFGIPGFGVPLAPCGSGPPAALFAYETAPAPLLLTAGLGNFKGPLFIAGKRFNSDEKDFLSDRLYGFDEYCNFIEGPFAMDDDRLNAKLVRDYEGELYQLNLEKGLVRLSDGYLAIPRDQGFPVVSEPRYSKPAMVYVGFQNQLSDTWGRPVLDVAFDSQGYAYVTPVVVRPDVNEPYVASAKLELEPIDTPPYHVVKIYDDPPLLNDNQDPNNNLREIEVDNEGRVYIINNCYINNGDLLRVYNSDGDVNKYELQNLDILGEPNGIYAPIGLHCSSYDNSRLYLASSLSHPDANSVSLHVLSTDDLTHIQTIDINNMGHITDITEDPLTGALLVVGFTEPNYISVLPGDLSLTPKFYKPYIAVVPYDSNTAEAVCLSGSDPNNDLALPMSIVWTGDKCSGADLDESGDVSFSDFAILARYWLADCTLPNDYCGGADLEPENQPDGDVDVADLAILARYWLGTGCLD